jgi:16S rRNA (uracil1498-N3)-methyltransferase
MADRFYNPGPLTSGEFVLEGPEAHHLATVRRIAAGARVILFCGDGLDYPAEIVAADRKRAVLNVLPPVAVDRELGFRLEIVAALPKGDRGDFLVEKLTELSATRLIPLQTQRSVVLPKENRLANLRHAVIEASKQCGRNVLMEIERLRSWPEVAASPDLPAVRVILHPGPDGVAVASLDSGAIRSGGIALAIGPEGGFSDEEIDEAERNEWRKVSLGPRILRVETAAIAMAAWVGASSW